MMRQLLIMWFSRDSSTGLTNLCGLVAKLSPEAGGLLPIHFQLLYCSNSILATFAVLWLAGTNHNRVISFLTWDVDFEDQCQRFHLISDSLHEALH